MSESKQRADEIKAAQDEAAKVHIQQAAIARAQAAHVQMIEAPAIFAPSFYLADAGGMVRIVMYEQATQNSPIIVRGAFLVPPAAFISMCQIAPNLIKQMAALEAQARALAEQQGPPPPAEIVELNGADAPAVQTAGEIGDAVHADKLN